MGENNLAAYTIVLRKLDMENGKVYSKKWGE
jgi:hypothetical protein